MPKHKLSVKRGGRKAGSFKTSKHLKRKAPVVKVRDLSEGGRPHHAPLDFNKERMTRRELMAKFELSYGTVCRFLEMKEGPKVAPDQTYNVKEFENFFAEKREAKKQEQALKKPLDQVREEKMRAEMEITRITIGKLKGEYIPKSEIAPVIATVMTELTQTLRANFEQELPSLYRGKTVMEISEMNAKAIDLLLMRFKEGTSRIQNVGIGTSV